MPRIGSSGFQGTPRAQARTTAKLQLKPPEACGRGLRMRDRGHKRAGFPIDACSQSPPTNDEPHPTQVQPAEAWSPESIKRNSPDKPLSVRWRVRPTVQKRFRTGCCGRGNRCDAGAGKVQAGASLGVLASELRVIVDAFWVSCLGILTSEMTKKGVG
jgi:hypothetical protein